MRERLLTSWSSSAGSMTIDYDPLLRMRYVSGSTYLFSPEGDDMVAEYYGSTLVGRFVHGPGMDEPLVQIDRFGTRTWFLADERGSIVAGTNSSGAAAQIKSYDEYGKPGGSTAYRFGFAGAPVLSPDIYYLRNRFYDWASGKFPQTDPIMYEGGMNLYGYVHGDPVNFTDPLGLRNVCWMIPYSGYDAATNEFYVGYDQACWNVSDEAERDWIHLREPGQVACSYVNGCVDIPRKQEPVRCPRTPNPPASRTYPVPPGFKASPVDKKHIYVVPLHGTEHLVLNPLYVQARAASGGVNWKGVAIDLLKIGGSMAWALKGGEIGASIPFSLSDVGRSGALVGSSAVKAAVSLDGHNCQ